MRAMTHAKFKLLPKTLLLAIATTGVTLLFSSSSASAITVTFPMGTVSITVDTDGRSDAELIEYQAMAYKEFERSRSEEALRAVTSFSEEFERRRNERNKKQEAKRWSPRAIRSRVPKHSSAPNIKAGSPGEPDLDLEPRYVHLSPPPGPHLCVERASALSNLTSSEYSPAMQSNTPAVAAPQPVQPVPSQPPVSPRYWLPSEMLEAKEREG